MKKLHAVVVRTTFRSQNVQNNNFGPLVEVEMSKKCTPFVARSKLVKMYKTPQCRTTFGSCDVEKCTPLLREAHFEVNMLKTPGVRTTFGSCDVEKAHAVVARSQFEVNMLRKTEVQTTFGSSDVASLRFSTLHYITLHST